METLPITEGNLRHLLDFVNGEKCSIFDHENDKLLSEGTFAVDRGTSFQFLFSKTVNREPIVDEGNIKITIKGLVYPLVDNEYLISIVKQTDEQYIKICIKLNLKVSPQSNNAYF